MSVVQPSAQTWTIRFKFHKSTILLHVDPNQSVKSLKENLHFALRDVKQNRDFLSGRAPPSSVSQIELGKPINLLDLSEGWESLEASRSETEEDEDFDAGKRKGKGKARSSGTQLSAQTVKESGIKDNAVLAFRWTDGIEETPQAEWDVVFPTFEDTYGMESVVDGGAIPRPRHGT